MKEDCTPAVHATRKIPIKLKQKLKFTLYEMVTNKIIAPVTEPTDWVGDI